MNHAKYGFCFLTQKVLFGQYFLLPWKGSIVLAVLKQTLKTAWSSWSFLSKTWMEKKMILWYLREVWSRMDYDIIIKCIFINQTQFYYNFICCLTIICQFSIQRNPTFLLGKWECYIWWIGLRIDFWSVLKNIVFLVSPLQLKSWLLKRLLST